MSKDWSSLGSAMTDTPDPLPVGASLTYQLSILNSGSINAPGVVVTDVLPGNVQIGEVSASQGSCIPGGTVNCDLGTLLSNSTASITVIVTPTVNGVITSTATVGSPGFELNLSDNTALETYLD